MKSHGTRYRVAPTKIDRQRPTGSPAEAATARRSGAGRRKTPYNASRKTIPMKTGSTVSRRSVSQPTASLRVGGGDTTGFQSISDACAASLRLLAGVVRPEAQHLVLVEAHLRALVDADDLSLAPVERGRRPARSAGYAAGSGTLSIHLPAAERPQREAVVGLPEGA